jgi:hypothetical protein
MPDVHHEHGPSSLNYKRVCPAWRNREGSSEYADEGELMHKAMETGYDEALDHEQLQMVDKCRSWINTMIASGHADDQQNEVKLTIKAGVHEIFGTTDLLVIQDDWTRGTMVDFKFGRLAVPEAEENMQALAYAIGIFQLYPKLDKLDVVFLLPRRDEVTRCSLTRDRLADYENVIAEILDRVHATEPEQVPFKGCEYCKHQGSCPALAGHISALAHKAPEGLTLPENMDVSTMTPEEIDEFALPMARLAEAWAKSVKARAMEMMKDGTELAHHEIAYRAKPQKLGGPITDCYALCNRLGISLTDFLESCSLSMSQLRSKGKRAKIANFEGELIAGGFLSDNKEKYETLKRK